MIGRRLQHYEIVEKLGEGGMGVVYKARDGHLGRLVAIKVLPPDKLADGVRKARFTQEAKAASALNHPNIVTIFDISSDEGCDFIAMEYVAGRTLEQLIGRRGLGLNEALKIAIQMADALARAHSTGIVHRDLKPSNVMVDEHGLVKILDFGVAKLTEPLPAGDDASTQTVKAATEEGTILGTAAYMSPEQAEGKSVDARSDIFSFGTVLYEMVSGRRAFEGDSMMPALSAVLHQEPKPVKDVPRDLEKIITRCLKKDPERRFQFMKDLRIELEELKEESDSGRLAAVSEAPVKGRRWSWVGGLAAAAVLVGIGALWRFWPLASTGQGGSPPSLQQLTSYVGFELSPTFSPDGKQVAFTWEGEKRDNWDIYVKLVGESNAVRLTSDAAPDTVPAWSPDGSRIAFQRRRRGAPGIWLVSPLGGGEEKIADLRVIGHMSWSPDGKWLAAALGGERGNVGHERGIVLIPLGGGEPLRVTNPKAPAYDVNPDFSGDGRQLAYATCASKWSCDVFVQALGPRYAPEGAPRRITTSGLYIDGIAWLRDGESLIYSGSRSWGMTPRLWRVRLHGGQEQERLDVAGFQARQPAVWRGATGWRSTAWPPTMTSGAIRRAVFRSRSWRHRCTSTPGSSRRTAEGSRFLRDDPGRPLKSGLPTPTAPDWCS